MIRAAWATFEHVCTRPWAELRYLLGCAGYWLRPYDMLADRRRWRWQARTRCRVWVPRG